MVKSFAIDVNANAHIGRRYISELGVLINILGES